MTNRSQGRMLAGSLALLMGAAVFAAACVIPIGESVERRPLTVLRFGAGPRAVLLIGGLHTGHEDNTRVIVEQFSRYFAEHPEAVPSSITLYVLPSVNPDGSANGTHTNARGVDLNRNWPADDWVADACHPASGCRPGLGGPAPLSEPETLTLYRFIEDKQPEITAVWHAEAPLVEANEVAGAEAHARVFAAAAGYPYVDEWTAYPITGQLIDALEERLGLRAFDVELSQCCEISPEEFDRNLKGVLALLRAIDGSTDAPGARPTPRATPTALRIPEVPHFSAP